MSMRIKLNVKNAILGCHNFSDILATHDTRIPSGFSRLVVPRAIPFCRPDFDYSKETSVRKSTLNNAEALLPRKSENLSLKWMSSEKPVTSKWLHKVLTGLICTPVCGLPWESAYSFYYDRKCPQCPPPAPTARTADCPKAPVPPCPPPKLVPKCPHKPKCHPCENPKKSDPCAKTTSCTMKSILLNNYRFYSASPSQPKPPRRKRAAGPCRKRRPCAPIRARYKLSPKCRPVPPALRSARPYTASKSRICKPKFGSKQDPCGGKSEPKSGGSNPVCPPKTKSASGGGSNEVNKGPVCPRK